MATIEDFPDGARKVVTGRRNIPTVLYVTRRGTMVPCEHLLEADAALLFDFDVNVLAIRSQPHRLRFVWGGERISYTPDFLVHYKGQELIIEVKSSDALAHSLKTRTRLSRIHVVYRALGLNYLVVTEKRIRIEPRLSNCKELLRYRKVSVTSSDRKRLEQHLSRVGSDALVALAQLIDAPHPVTAVKALAAQGHLSIDLGVPLGPNSMVHLPQPDNKGVFE